MYRVRLTDAQKQELQRRRGDGQGPHSTDPDLEHRNAGHASIGGTGREGEQSHDSCANRAKGNAGLLLVGCGLAPHEHGLEIPKRHAVVPPALTEDLRSKALVRKRGRDTQ
jgi:hypothetical protein